MLCVPTHTEHGGEYDGREIFKYNLIFFIEMQKEYLRYFAKYKGPEMYFTELCEYMAKEFGVRDITRQPLIKTIGFSADSKEVVEKIKKLDQIIKIECHGSIL